MARAPMVSYAQNHEDVLLRRRVFPEQRQGFYVDIGANDPVSLSITKHFYESGWSGLNIEPLPSMFGRLLKDRPRDINLNVGIADGPGVLELYEAIGANGGLSTFSVAQMQEHARLGIQFNAHRIQVSTLAAVLERHARRPIDFMSIDVEGHEGEVLRGGDWKRWRPRVLVIEAIVPLTNKPSHQQWEHLVLGADYLYAFFDGVNRYYVRAEDRELLPAFASPVNATDDYVHYECHQMLTELRADPKGNAPHYSAELLRIAARLHAIKARFPRLLGIARTSYRRAKKCWSYVLAGGPQTEPPRAIVSQESSEAPPTRVAGSAQAAGSQQQAPTWDLLSPLLNLGRLTYPWQMEPQERLALITLTERLRPEVAIEVGTHGGGSLAVLAGSSGKVYSLDIDPSCRTRLSQHFRNSEFITGSSRETLRPLLKRLQQEKAGLGLVLIDGDHSAAGVRADIEDVLTVTPGQPLLIVLHDSFNPDVRAGILGANWEANSYVHALDVDFVPGVAFGQTMPRGQMWGGLALAILLPTPRQGTLVPIIRHDYLFTAMLPHSPHRRAA